MTESKASSGLLGGHVTRRDFCNATLVGAGATLLTACGSSGDAGRPESEIGPGAAWNGPSGVGEYSGSNGVTWRTMEAGHRIRDGAIPTADSVRDTGERYDLVVVGGGFAGLGALHAFRKANPTGRCLLLDNQEIFGGYAKANEFDVDGYRIAGAQASLNFVLPRSPSDRGGAQWTELGLPAAPRFAEREDGRSGIVFAASSSGPLYYGEQTASTGYHFGARGWVRDIWRDDLSRAPFPPETKAALLAMRERRRQGPLSDAEARRLDGMTFAEFATRELKATPEALRYITQGMCITGPELSAYGARSFPNLERYAGGSVEAELGDRFISFPEGNAVLARAFVKAVLPDAVQPSEGGEGFLGRIVPQALDRARSSCRIRQGATVIEVANVGKGVEVVYRMNGRHYRVQGDTAVLGVGAWVAKRIVKDLTAEHRAAFDRYHYSPMLMANVALRNWRFLDKLGISSARWFDGTGFYCNVRKPMVDAGGRAPPFHPDKPIVMTLYAPFPRAGLPLAAQGPDARMELYSTSFAQYERRIVAQLQEMFGAGGFDARRDVAGIVLNRWGHAFVTPPPGFYFAPPGAIAPAAAFDHMVGRIAFGRSEDWLGSALSGAEAVARLAT